MFYKASWTEGSRSRSSTYHVIMCSLATIIPFHSFSHFITSCSPLPFFSTVFDMSWLFFVVPYSVSSTNYGLWANFKPYFPSITSYGDRPMEFEAVVNYFKQHFTQVHKRNNENKRVLFTHLTSVVVSHPIFYLASSLHVFSRDFGLLNSNF